MFLGLGVLLRQAMGQIQVVQQEEEQNSHKLLFGQQRAAPSPLNYS